MRRLALVTILAPALASADIATDLKECKGFPTSGARRVVKDDAVISGKSLAFPELDGGGCEVYKLGGKVAKATGSFFKGTSAIAITYGACDEEHCPIAVAIRSADGTIIAAQRTDANCDYSIQLKPIKLRPDHDDLLLVCRSSAAGGYAEQQSLVDVSADNVVLFYTLDTGSYMAMSEAEKKAGEKPLCPIGGLAVEKVDAKPLLRVRDLQTAALSDGKGTVAGKQYAIDFAHHAVTATGAPDTAIKVDARAACKSR